MSQPLLYGPNGKPVDRREDWQVEFDRRLRQQMSDNGGQFVPRRFVEAMKNEFERRPQFEEPTRGESFRSLFNE